MSNLSDFVIEDGILTKYKGPGGDVEIPDGVTGIGNAFKDCTNLKSVTIPESVKGFSASAFKGCTGLADKDGFIIVRDVLMDYIGPGGDIAIPESVKQIAGAAFFRNEKITGVSIPDSVKKISGAAFLGCKGLTDANGFVIVRGILFDYTGSDRDVTIPEGVTGIGDAAFCHCDALTSVAIPEGVTFIGNRAFFSRVNLNAIKIPEGVTEIGIEAFKGCKNLANVSLPGSLKTVGKEAFSDCISLNAIKIPEGVTEIGIEAFKGCKNLVSVSFPGSLKSVGKGAFSNCVSLREKHICDLASWCGIQLNENAFAFWFQQYPDLYFDGALLKELSFSDDAVPSVVTNFHNCKSLTKVTIPEGVESIGKAAFFNCENITSLTIPESVTDIGLKAFTGCKGLADADGFVIVNGILFEYTGSGGEVTIPDTVKKIEKGVFQSCESLTKITLPEGLTSIEENTFQGCKNLTGVVIPKSVTDIGDDAFYGCEALTDIKIPEGVKSIGEGAFKYCKSLSAVSIPGGVKSIEKNTFGDCDNLKQVILSEGVESIGEDAFWNCESLKSITIPRSLKRVDEGAFWSCDALKEIHIQDLAMWAGVHFHGKNSNLLKIGYGHHPDLYLNGAPLTEIDFPESASDSKITNFCNINSLVRVTIPEGVTAIGDDAFSWCENLESVVLPESVTSIGKSAFYGCKNLKNITFPKALTNIGESAFWNCGSLITVTIPENVTSIGKRAFQHCTGLTQVMIPDNVKDIGDLAFTGCTNLIRAVLPKKLQKIGCFAFASCPSLAECEIPPSVSSWGSIPAAYEDGVYYTETEGKKEILEVFAPGRKEYKIPDWAYKIREDAMIGAPLKQVDVSAGTIIDENAFGKNTFVRNTVELTGSFMETREELPSYYTNYFEKAVKTPEVLACRLLYQSGKQWNETLTKATQSADKAAVIRAMAVLVAEEAEEKLASKFADTVLDYLAELSKEEMKSSYVVLRNGSFKALRKLVLDEGFQEKWFAQPEQEEALPVEKLVKDNWKTTEAVKKLRKVVKNGIRYRDSDAEASPNVLIFIVNEYASQLENPAKLPIGMYQSYYIKCHVSELADQVAAALNTEELREALEKLAYVDKTFRNGFILALARYGSGKQISHLCSQMRERANWGDHGVAGRQDVIIARSALMLSETREAMMALDKGGFLDVYAAMRNTDADTIRDTVLSDFGFDQDGKKAYDLGGNKVSVSMADDLTLLLFDENAEKYVKSIPKKNADPALFEAAKADFSDLKKNIKRVIKHRRDVIFDDFLSGLSRDAANWKKLYYNNPVLHAVARLIVWEQGGKTFTLTDTGAIDCHGNSVAVEDHLGIRVAHPIEMKAEEIKEWQEYFVRNNLKQPFEQIWEPVYDPNAIAPDRYEGSVLPIYRFENKDQHGIHSYGLTAYSEDYGFELEDCELDAEGSTWRIVPGETDDETYTLGKFKLIEHTRKSNHIIFVLDKWTITDRIEKDDDSISLMLPVFTLAQITEFIRLANEKNSSVTLAVLMDYKNKNFADADPFAEFTLD